LSYTPALNKLQGWRQFTAVSNKGISWNRHWKTPFRAWSQHYRFTTKKGWLGSGDRKKSFKM